MEEVDREWSIREDHKNDEYIKKEFNELKERYKKFSKKYPNILKLHPEYWERQYKEEYEELLSQKTRLGWFIDEEGMWRYKK